MPNQSASPVEISTCRDTEGALCGDEDDDLVAHSCLGASSAAAVRDGGIAVALLAEGSAVPCQAEDGEGCGGGKSITAKRRNYN